MYDERAIAGEVEKHTLLPRTEPPPPRCVRRWVRYYADITHAERALRTVCLCLRRKEGFPRRATADRTPLSLCHGVV